MNIVRRILFGITLALTFGILTLIQSSPAIANSLAPSTATTYLIAQEPNQDSLQMQCNGSMASSDTNFNAFFTREAGFSRIILRRRSTGQPIAETFLSFDRQNDKGQAIWRGSVNEMASVTLVHLSSNPAQPGDEVSVSYDGQWGRGTCN